MLNKTRSTNPTIADLDQFDEIIDVRSPAEFAEDHIPGAINCPVLDNDQRIEVGTLYKQVSAFEAKKIGAAMVSENIGRHLRANFLDRQKNWKPLIYCWLPYFVLSAGRLDNSRAVTKPTARMWSARWKRCHNNSTLSLSAVPQEAPKRACCKRLANWASKFWI